MNDFGVRPWGHYEVLANPGAFKIKTIYVESGQRLSYQRHQHRAEHWFIVRGEATVVLDGTVFKYKAGDSVDVAIGQLHRIGNESKNPLVFIEVQTGSYFGEDDIERLEDDYSRGQSREE